MGASPARVAVLTGKEPIMGRSRLLGLAVGLALVAAAEVFRQVGGEFS